MKTSAKILGWEAVTGKLNRWWSLGVKSTIAEDARPRLPNKFSSWLPSKPYMGLLSRNSEKFKVDFRLLERLLEQALPNEISYKRFIASHLQHQSLDVRSTADMMKSLALQRMLSLVGSTIADMKMVELNHIAKNKG